VAAAARRRSRSSDTGRRRQPARDSREQLLRQASHLFLTGGFQGVGIAEICTTAEVQKGTFYHFFESKSHLLLEVIERHAAEINQSILNVALGDGPASRKILALFAMGRASAHEKSVTLPGYFLGNIVLELAPQNAAVREATRAAFALWTKSISRIVAQLIAEERLHSLDAQDAAEAVLGLLQGAAVMANAYNDPRKMRGFAHTCLELLRTTGSAAKP
jgi:TetR/AcrR family transcriptional repressor of nem operon